MKTEGMPTILNPKEIIEELNQTFTQLMGYLKLPDNKVPDRREVADIKFYLKKIISLCKPKNQDRYRALVDLLDGPDVLRVGDIKKELNELLMSENS